LNLQRRLSRPEASPGGCRILRARSLRRSGSSCLREAFEQPSSPDIRQFYNDLTPLLVMTARE
jgi:hypothetical protein